MGATILEAAGAAKRAAIRATAGAGVRARSAKADNLAKRAELLDLRSKSLESLQPEDFKRAAKAWNIHPAALHALADAESKGRGIEPDGRLLILPEPHVFSALTAHAFDLSHPHVSYPKWIPSVKGAAPPGGFDRHPYTYSQSERWQLIADMLELDIEAGLGSMSAGRFQQLVGSRNKAEGWKALGFANGEALFRELAQGELAHLVILHRFLTVNGLLKALRAMDWKTVARGYNGAGQVAAYSASMEKAYRNRKGLYA